MEKIKNKLKSKVFWVSFVLIIAELLKLFGIYEISDENISLIQDLITNVFLVFSALNNPDTTEEF